MSLNVEEGNAGGNSGGSIVDAVVAWAKSLQEFIPIGLKPAIPPVCPAAIKGDPYDALTKYITINIYIFPFCIFIFTFFYPVQEYTVRGGSSCSPYYGIPIVSMIIAFIEAFFWGWVDWYMVVKMKCADNRCPCCLGGVCYLIMGIFHVLYGILGLLAVSHLQRYPGCDLFSFVVAFGHLLQVIPGLLMGACFLIIYKS